MSVKINSIDDLWTMLVIGVCALVIIGLIVMFRSFTSDRREQQEWESSLGGTCLDYGYPREVIKGGEIYCVRSVNGTDIVARLSRVREEHTVSIKRPQ